jgi:hypothetical protein
MAFRDAVVMDEAAKFHVCDVTALLESTDSVGAECAGYCSFG